MTYQHAEAFCLLTYHADDGTEEEKIWNSRDGITPFVIALRSGKAATHVNWRTDRPDQGYQPQIGERIFVDMTRERARQIAEANVDRWLADAKLGPMLLAGYTSRDAAIEYFTREYFQPGAPDLIVVAG